MVVKALKTVKVAKGVKRKISKSASVVPAKAQLQRADWIKAGFKTP